MDIPVRSDEPPPRPNVSKNFRPKRGKTLAIVGLKKSLLARTDPTNLGYDNEMYIKIDWKVR